MKPLSDNSYDFYHRLITLRDHRDELSPGQLAEIMRSVALNAPDHAAAAAFADISGDDWAHIYPIEDTTPRPGTDDAIDTFISTYGQDDEKETALLERLIFNPTPEYTLTLDNTDDASPSPASSGTSRTPAAGKTQSPDTQSALIDAFISSHPEGAPARHQDSRPVHNAPVHKEEPTAAAPSPGDSLSESLAKIFIKQGRYKQAYEIISNINLKYPEKSIYFADQLRFLEKVIEIQQRRARRKASEA